MCLEINRSREEWEREERSVLVKYARDSYSKFDLPTNEKGTRQKRRTEFVSFEIIYFMDWSGGTKGRSFKS